MAAGGRIERWKARAARLKVETYALCLACRHPGVPWYAKAFTACVVAYAVSPIDLIPDFIPVLGYLDDLVLVPLGIYLALRMVPPAVLGECRCRAREAVLAGGARGRAAAAVVVAVWLLAAALAVVLLLRLRHR